MAIEVRTQAQLDKAIKRQEKSGELIVLVGDGYFSLSSSPTVVARESSSPTVVAWESSSPTVEAWESSSPTVEAWESSSPRVVAWESSSPRVVAWGSSSPRVEARGSSSPRVVARGSSSPRVEAWESSSPRVEAWESSSVAGSVGKFAALVASKRQQAKLSIPGAVLLKEPKIKTAEDWCDYYGVEIVRGIATLFKAVGQDYETQRGVRYTPGTKPEAPDWDGGKAECGGGLHFSPSPMAALRFNSEPAHFVACPVKVSEIVVHPDGVYPDKVKVPRVAKPCYEVARDGERLPEAAAVGGSGGLRP